MAYLAPMIATADVQMDDHPEHALAKSNPHLQPYTGTEDPAMWVLQVKAAFDAHDTALAKQGKWMVCALRGAAISLSPLFAFLLATFLVHFLTARRLCSLASLRSAFISLVSSRL